MRFRVRVLRAPTLLSRWIPLTSNGIRQSSSVPRIPVPLWRRRSFSCKTLKGLLYGGLNPRVSTPMLLSMYRDGNLKLDELVTRRYRLDQINDAFADMREGRNIRGIIEFD